jgi:sulfite exporter TauE/SafE
MLFVTAFLTGLLGSFHCIGMCGPIALALPVQGTPFKTMLGRIIYSLGRIITYSILGILMGTIGLGLQSIGFQQTVSIVSGSLVIIVLLFFNNLYVFAPFRRLASSLKQAFGTILRKSGFWSLFVLGLVNGLLPCGFVYIGLAGSVATAEWWKGGIYMALFGFGTAPLMLAFTYTIRLITPSWRSFINRYSPVFAVLVGMLLIIRGLNLGVPVISPKAIGDKHCMEMKCCK